MCKRLNVKIKKIVSFGCDVSEKQAWSYNIYLVLNLSKAAIPKQYILLPRGFLRASSTYRRAIPSAMYLHKKAQ